MDVPIDDLIRVQDELSERIADSLAEPLSPREQAILKRDAPASPRAYELYLARGAGHGRDMEDWLQAERELKLGRY